MIHDSARDRSRSLGSWSGVSLGGGSLIGACLAGVALLALSGVVQAQDVPVLVTAQWVAEHRDDLVVVNIHPDDGNFREEHIPGAQFVGSSEFISDRKSVV